VSDESNGPEGGRQHVRFVSEPGVEISGKLYLPHSSQRSPAVLVVADKMSNSSIPSTDWLAERIARTGRVVLELEPRDAPGEGDRPFVGNWLTNARADQIGRNLPAMRAHDIVRGVDLLAARQDVDPAAIRAVARGVKGIWLLLAAAVDTRIGKIWLDRTPYSLRAALENSMNTDLFDAVISRLCASLGLGRPYEGHGKSIRIVDRSHELDGAACSARPAVSISLHSRRHDGSPR